MVIGSMPYKGQSNRMGKTYWGRMIWKKVDFLNLTVSDSPLWMRLEKFFSIALSLCYPQITQINAEEETYFHKGTGKEEMVFINGREIRYELCGSVGRALIAILLPPGLPYFYKRLHRRQSFG